ncbi:MAG: helix-hairpin-helix domain-containing protein [bacterium]
MKKELKSLTSLPNIGKTTMEKLHKIGINTTDEFLSRDPYEVFDELLKKVDPTLCRCALAGIVGAKLGVPWHKVTKKSAAEFEKRHPDFKWGKC